MSIRFLVATLSMAVSMAACGGGGGGGGTNGPSPGTGETGNGGATPPAAQPNAADFNTRCTQPGVIRCIGFDDVADFNTGSGDSSGAYGDNFGLFPVYGTSDFSNSTRDTAQKASGNSSLKFTIPSNSGAGASGSFFANFSKDLSVQFGGDSEFYIQWRQRFSPEFIDTEYANANGWKQVIVSTGDVPGKTPANSCTALETVVQNYYNAGFPIMYNSCTGSDSHGAYDIFEEPFGGYDFKFQNARPSPYCLYSQSSSSYFAPTGNCFGYVPNEWMTFQLRIKTGPRVGNEFKNSYITLWMSRQGKPAEQVINWGPYNLSAGDPANNERFGKVWLLPYNTSKSSAQSHPTAYTWYDELIISRNRIGEPANAAAPSRAPAGAHAPARRQDTATGK